MKQLIVLMALSVLFVSGCVSQNSNNSTITSSQIDLSISVSKSNLSVGENFSANYTVQNHGHDIETFTYIKVYANNYKYKCDSVSIRYQYENDSAIFGGSDLGAIQFDQAWNSCGASSFNKPGEYVIEVKIWSCPEVLEKTKINCDTIKDLLETAPSIYSKVTPLASAMQVVNVV
jgi:hypothetical protein